MPIKYIPFIPEPVEGQAVLGNFNRVLRYKGADELSMTLQRGMPLYEMEKQETVGENTDGNMVIRGECVSACAYLKEQGVQVDLVYIDPPFASGADYAKKVYIRRNPKVAESIAQAERELDVDELKAFEEKMYGDVWDKEKYLSWMYENLMAIKGVMSETASIYVHLDYHIGHYVKILMDEIFGEAAFQNEIVWKRTTSRAGSGYYNHIHDVIFFYTLSDDAFWEQQYTPYTQEYLDSMFKHTDPDGRRWRESPLTAPGVRYGSSGAEWRGFNPTNIGKGRHWTIPSFVRESLSDEGKADTLVALDEFRIRAELVQRKLRRAAETDGGIEADESAELRAAGCAAADPAHCDSVRSAAGDGQADEAGRRNKLGTGGNSESTARTEAVHRPDAGAEVAHGDAEIADRDEQTAGTGWEPEREVFLQVDRLAPGSQPAGGPQMDRSASGDRSGGTGGLVWRGGDPRPVPLIPAVAGLSAVGTLLDEDEDAEEMRRRIEAKIAAENFGAVIGFAAGAAMAVKEKLDEQSAQEKQKQQQQQTMGGL